MKLRIASVVRLFYRAIEEVLFILEVKIVTSDEYYFYKKLYLLWHVSRTNSVSSDSPLIS